MPTDPASIISNMQLLVRATWGICGWPCPARVARHPAEHRRQGTPASSSSLTLQARGGRAAACRHLQCMSLQQHAAVSQRSVHRLQLSCQQHTAGCLKSWRHHQAAGHSEISWGHSCRGGAYKSHMLDVSASRTADIESQRGRSDLSWQEMHTCGQLLETQVHNMGLVRVLPGQIKAKPPPPPPRGTHNTGMPLGNWIREWEHDAGCSDSSCIMISTISPLVANSPGHNLEAWGGAL